MAVVPVGFTAFPVDGFVLFWQLHVQISKMFSFKFVRKLGYLKHLQLVTDLAKLKESFWKTVSWRLQFLLPLQSSVLIYGS